jgi:hypothetical protein
VFLKSFQLIREADWVLGNFFDDLESQAVNLKPPVLHVGLLLPSSIWTQYDSSDWLDAKPNG